MKDIVITLPQSISWKDYEKELDAVKDWKQVMNFKVFTLPKELPEKCYLIHNGKLMGWMKVVGVSDDSFKCTTTKKDWTGKFIQRSGPFHYIDKNIEMKGFRGWRYFDIDNV